MNINIQNSNSMSDKKKFWLVTVIYLIVFWVLPLWPSWMDSFFIFFDKMINSFGVKTQFALVYFFIFIPLIIILCYLLVRKFNIKFKKIIFALFYIIIPYLVILSYYFYALTHVSFSGFL
ncbi:MAG: hypothetical protein WCP24_03255 [bacterium]